MSKIISIIGDIDQESFNRFIDDINSTEKGDDIQVYLNSRGGVMHFVPAFKRVMEDYKVHLVAFGNLSSSALLLFIDTKTSKEIFDDTVVIYHYPFLPNIDVSAITLKPIDDLDWNNNAKVFKDNYGYIDDILGISKKQKKKLLKGKDIAFTPKDIRKVMKKMH